jgi:hypothetical protein
MPKGDCSRALALMRQQHMEDWNGEIDHMYMTAGERVVELLAQYGLVKPDSPGGVWTK